MRFRLNTWISAFHKISCSFVSLLESSGQTVDFNLSSCSCSCIVSASLRACIRVAFVLYSNKVSICFLFFKSEARRSFCVDSSLKSGSATLWSSFISFTRLSSCFVCAAQSLSRVDKSLFSCLSCSSSFSHRLMMIPQFFNFVASLSIAFSRPPKEHFKGKGTTVGFVSWSKANFADFRLPMVSVCSSLRLFARFLAFNFTSVMSTSEKANDSRNSSRSTGVIKIKDLRIFWGM